MQVNRKDAATSTRLHGAPFSLTLKGTVKIAEESFPGLRPAIRLASRIARRTSWPTTRGRAAVAERSASTVEVETRFQSTNQNLSISGVSKWVIRHTNIERVVDQRRQNYTDLCESLSEIPGVRTLFPVLPPDNCPWVLPLRLEDYSLAHWRLREFGIPATAWEGVRPEQVSKAGFPNADFLYENVFFLPVHQSLTQDHLRQMRSAVEALSRSRSRKLAQATK